MRFLKNEQREAPRKDNGGRSAGPVTPAFAARSQPSSWVMPAGTTVTNKPRWMIGEPPRELVELRPRSKPRVTVSLRSSVWQKLRDHARETSDGRETAGFLFGPHVRSWKSVSVGWVTRMVTDRNEDTCKLDMHALFAERDSLRAPGVTDIDEQGSWHIHPSMDGRPSDVDLSNWLSSLDFLGRSFYVGPILTADPSDERWSNPHVHAWVVRRDGHFQRPVCEPAKVRP